MNKVAKTKKIPKTINRRKSRYILTLCLIFIIGSIFGLTASFLVRDHDQTILVWQADKNVKVPDGLVSYLEKNDSKDCRDYKGTGSVTGMALFSIFESSQNRLAKMTYGCGNNLTSQYEGYIVAYKSDGKWKLTRPTRYFIPVAESSAQLGKSNSYPSCAFLDENNIPASFEPSCVAANGTTTRR